uniref:Uncharacterized protein n=1 Tax=Quercus lobata TaxID=97700 RepID=A0A7N2MYT8_QUELO
MYVVRENLQAARKEFAKIAEDLKSLQNVGQIIGEVLRPLDNERCNINYLCAPFLLIQLYIIRFMKTQANYSAVGGLSYQIIELREPIDLPLMNPELFLRVGIKPAKGVLLYGPLGTGHC